MINQEESLKVRRKAMHLLEIRDRTEKELREKLRRAEFSEEAVDHAVSYVKSYGYIDDDRYARNYLTWRMHDKSRGKLFTELAQKGISKEKAQLAWDEITEYETPDEMALLCKTIEKKALPGSELDDKKMRSLYGFLLRRGFTYEAISSALRELDIKLVHNRQNW